MTSTGYFNLESHIQQKYLTRVRGNQDIFRWRETKGICHHQTYPETALGNSLSGNETTREHTLDCQVGTRIW